MTMYEETLRALLMAAEADVERARDALESQHAISLLEHKRAFIAGQLVAAAPTEERSSSTNWNTF